MPNAGSGDVALIHLAECDPDTGKAWEETTFREALAASGRMCPQTLYMENELFADEPVWLDKAGRFGDWMLTYSGQVFYPLDPRADEINPLDIAHALSMICRFGGHTCSFYSVAEHCVLMSHRVAPEHALWALLHDATEAYMGDMIRPLKRYMPEYVTAEERLMRVICDRFQLPYDCPAEVKEADTRILVDERAALLAPCARPWKSTENVSALKVPVLGWDPAEARRRFLDRLAELDVEAYRNGP